MAAERMRIGEVLVEAGVLSAEQLEQALVLQKEDGKRLGTILLERGFVSEPQLIQALSHHFSVPWVSIARAEPPDEVLQLVPPFVASKYGLVPVYKRRTDDDGESLYVAMDDPTNEEALKAVASCSGLDVRPMVAAPSEIAAAIIEFYEDEEVTGQIRLPAFLLEAAEASGRHSIPYDEMSPMEPVPELQPPAGDPDMRDTVQMERSEAPKKEGDEEYIVVGPAPPEEWDGYSAGAVFAPGVDATPPQLDRPDSGPVAGAPHGVDGDTDKLEAAKPGSSGHGSEDRIVTIETGLEPGTVDERLEDIEARLKAEETASETGETTPRARKTPSVTLTLLDGTKVDFGGPPAPASSEPVRSVDELVELLRLSGHGQPVPKALPHAHWELFLADILEALARKGLLTDEDLFGARATIPGDPPAAADAAASQEKTDEIASS